MILEFTLLSLPAVAVCIGVYIADNYKIYKPTARHGRIIKRKEV